MKLILVYNATSSIRSKIMDAAHKFISPSTYNCTLCSLTHDNIGPKGSWKEFLRETDANVVVMYADKFESDFNRSLFIR